MLNLFLLRLKFVFTEGQARSEVEERTVFLWLVASKDPLASFRRYVGMSLQQDMKFPTSCSNEGRFRLLLLRRNAQVFVCQNRFCLRMPTMKARGCSSGHVDERRVHFCQGAAGVRFETEEPFVRSLHPLLSVMMVERDGLLATGLQQDLKLPVFLHPRARERCLEDVRGVRPPGSQGSHHSPSLEQTDSATRR